jgi:hypothetical protein
VIENLLLCLSLANLPRRSIAYISRAIGIPDSTLSEQWRHCLDLESFNWF